MAPGSHNESVHMHNRSGNSCLWEKGHRFLGSDPNFVLGSHKVSLGFGFPICTLWVTNLPCKIVMGAPGDAQRMAAVVIVTYSTVLLISLPFFLLTFLFEPCKAEGTGQKQHY